MKRGEITLSSLWVSELCSVAAFRRKVVAPSSGGPILVEVVVEVCREERNVSVTFESWRESDQSGQREGEWSGYVMSWENMLVT
jgi:hypothetical protein